MFLKRYISFLKVNIPLANFAILANFPTQDCFSCQATPKVEVNTPPK